MLYKCDPRKNKECPKNECFIYGGECSSTTNESFKDSTVNNIYISAWKELAHEYYIYCEEVYGRLADDELIDINKCIERLKKRYHMEESNE